MHGFGGARRRDRGRKALRAKMKKEEDMLIHIIIIAGIFANAAISAAMLKTVNKKEKKEPISTEEDEAYLKRKRQIESLLNYGTGGKKE